MLVIIAIILIVSGGGGKKPSTVKPMAAYAGDPSAQVAMLIDGPVNAVSLHNQVQVIITNSVTTINVFQGYNDQVINSKNYPMTEAAFHVFLRSLEYANFNSGSSDPSLAQASGYCPTGDRYIFTYNLGGKQLQRYWATSCGGTHTYNGNLGLTLQLFEAQVPNYNNLTSGLNL